MAKIRNVSGNDLIVPSLAGRLVLAGQVVELDAAEVHGFTQQTTNWEAADKAAQTAHNKAEAELAPPADVPAATNDTPES